MGCEKAMATKILIVDDDSGTLEFYRFVLEGAGFTVEAASDATTAMAACEAFNPDMLLLDWDMPGGGGKAVLNKIWTLLGKKIPALFITGMPEKVDVDLLAGRISVLTKPVNIDTLLSHVDSLLK
ncbi:MAG: response regulator transcription factor [Elusimicrobia bacterium]|nr:response regulator transcription factor [Elusimicrobiota bacterium]